MENPGFTRSKPLSYDAMKAVVKSFSLETRKSINNRIPSLRVINSQFPYQLENFKIATHSVEVNKIEWFFDSVHADGVENVHMLNPIVIPNICDLQMYSGDNMFSGRHWKQTRRLEKSPDAAYQQIFDAYIKNGTRIRNLYLRVPQLLMEKNPEDLSLKVQNLVISVGTTEEYERLFQFVDLATVESVRLNLFLNNQGILNKPEITTCKTLTMIASRNTCPSVDKLLSLQNQHIILHSPGFTHAHLQNLVRAWIVSDLPIGSRFSLGQNDYNDVLEILKWFQEHMGADSWEHPGLGDSFHAHGVKLNMGEDRDLVMFGGTYPKKKKESHIAPWVFQMEVMAANGTVPVDRFEALFI